jgi:hypothetical protein
MLFFFFLLICIVWSGVLTGSTRHVSHLLAYCSCPGWLWGWRIWWNEWQGKPKYSEKTCPVATLSTTNPTWPDPGLNPGRRGGKPVTNRFSEMLFRESMIVNLKIIWNQYILCGRYAEFSAHFPYFEKIIVGWCNRHAVCVSVYPPINIWMPEPIFIKLGMYFLNPSHKSGCLYVYPSYRC